MSEGSQSRPHGSSTTSPSMLGASPPYQGAAVTRGELSAVAAWGVESSFPRLESREQTNARPDQDGPRDRLRPPESHDDVEGPAELGQLANATPLWARFAREAMQQSAREVPIILYSGSVAADAAFTTLRASFAQARAHLFSGAIGLGQEHELPSNWIPAGGAASVDAAQRQSQWSTNAVEATATRAAPSRRAARETRRITAAAQAIRAAAAAVHQPGSADSGFAETGSADASAARWTGLPAESRRRATAVASFWIRAARDAMEAANAAALVSTSGVPHPNAHEQRPAPAAPATTEHVASPRIREQPASLAPSLPLVELSSSQDTDVAASSSLRQLAPLICRHPAPGWLAAAAA